MVSNSYVSKTRCSIVILLGTAARTLQSRGLRTLQVGPLAPEEKQAAITRYLEISHKTLEPQHLQVLLLAHDVGSGFVAACCRVPGIVTLQARIIHSFIHSMLPAQWWVQ